jgi:pantoate--beta-alanine ligase
MHKVPPTNPTTVAAPPVVTSREEIRRLALRARSAGQTLGVVPTMGALHAGHLSLVERSVAENDRTFVTIFVNPTQFGPHEDFAQYPRDLARDLELLTPYGVDVVFAPGSEEMYRPDHVTAIDVGPVAQRWEGASRPGHFRGVATVVLKLLNLIPADRAYFGHKDYQQVAVIRRMVADLDVPIEIRVCPTVREADGLAMSSRNAYLSPAEREQALVLSQSLRQGAEQYERGQHDPRRLTAAMREMIAANPQVELDYLAIVDPQTLEEVSTLDAPAVVIVAAKVGTTRLIDNWPLGCAEPVLAEPAGGAECQP